MFQFVNNVQLAISLNIILRNVVYSIEFTIIMYYQILLYYIDRNIEAEVIHVAKVFAMIRQLLCLSVMRGIPMQHKPIYLTLQNLPNRIVYIMFGPKPKIKLVATSMKLYQIQFFCLTRYLIRWFVKALNLESKVDSKNI